MKPKVIQLLPVLLTAALISASGAWGQTDRQGGFGAWGTFSEPGELQPLGLDGVVPLSDLHYTDPRFNQLYDSAIASKNRLIQGQRLETYVQPRIYRYTLKEGEDIWTLVARTSLNIDTIVTLNRIEFTGAVREESTVYLPDTLGLFHRAAETRPGELALRYRVDEADILRIEDPLTDGQLLFVPEAVLPFLTRTYLTGVVFHTPLIGIETGRVEEGSIGTAGAGYGDTDAPTDRTTGAAGSGGSVPGAVDYDYWTDPFINEQAFEGGVTIRVPEGKKVHASRWGEVVYAEQVPGYEYVVVLGHELGYYTSYAGLGELLVEAGEEVPTGQVLGRAGPAEQNDPGETTAAGEAAPEDAPRRKTFTGTTGTGAGAETESETDAAGNQGDPSAGRPDAEYGQAFGNIPPPGMRESAGDRKQVPEVPIRFAIHRFDAEPGLSQFFQ
jgi:murein DD-endopeptidase MepM/ murein hydrolase activator NlpD